MRTKITNYASAVYRSAIPWIPLSTLPSPRFLPTTNGSWALPVFSFQIAR